jgi:hypothetical protein
VAANADALPKERLPRRDTKNRIFFTTVFIWLIIGGQIITSSMSGKLE